MPRSPRVHFSGAIYHATNRGVNRQPIFRNDSDRRRFLSELRASLSQHGASLFSYCLMTNHFHLLIRVGDTPIGVIMRELLGNYSAYFNSTEGRVGHLFQGRYKAKLCKTGRQLLNTVVYIHMNPVEAAMVESPAKWPWCSHEEFLAGHGPLIDLKALEESTGFTPEDLREAYLQRLTEALTPNDEGGIEDVLASTAARHGVSPDDLRAGRRGGDYTQARREFIVRAAKRGYSDADSARTLACSRAAIALLRARR